MFAPHLPPLYKSASPKLDTGRLVFLSRRQSTSTAGDYARLWACYRSLLRELGLIVK